LGRRSSRPLSLKGWETGAYRISTGRNECSDRSPGVSLGRDKGSSGFSGFCTGAFILYPNSNFTVCPPVGSAWAQALVRIAQESLTNTLKHAKARRFGGGPRRRKVRPNLSPTSATRDCAEGGWFVWQRSMVFIIISDIMRPVGCLGTQEPGRTRQSTPTNPTCSRLVRSSVSAPTSWVEQISAVVDINREALLVHNLCRGGGFVPFSRVRGPLGGLSRRRNGVRPT
jgi:hypothetical protein